MHHGQEHDPPDGSEQGRLEQGTARHGHQERGLHSGRTECGEQGEPLEAGRRELASGLEVRRE